MEVSKKEGDEGERERDMAAEEEKTEEVQNDPVPMVSRYYTHSV